MILTATSIMVLVIKKVVSSFFLLNCISVTNLKLALLIDKKITSLIYPCPSWTYSASRASPP